MLHPERQPRDEARCPVMDIDNLRRRTPRRHADSPPSGWQQVASLAIAGTVVTVTAVLTGSAETAVVAVSPLLPFLAIR